MVVELNAFFVVLTMEHLQGIIPVQEDWHAGIYFMKVIILLLQHIYVQLIFSTKAIWKQLYSI